MIGDEERHCTEGQTERDWQRAADAESLLRQFERDARDESTGAEAQHQPDEALVPGAGHAGEGPMSNEEEATSPHSSAVSIGHALDLARGLTRGFGGFCRGATCAAPSRCRPLCARRRRTSGARACAAH